MTYQLRRLEWHGIIARIPGTFRYRLTYLGLQTATAYTPTDDRVLRPARPARRPNLPSELRSAYDRFAARSCPTA